jgi:hypothetical protein
VLDNVLGRNTFKKNNKTLSRIGNTEVSDNQNFRLFLQTRLPNPLYKPEGNAQTTLSNFMVTESGLEDQLLAVVVNHERPELEERRTALIRSMNTMTIELRQCVPDGNRILYVRPDGSARTVDVDAGGDRLVLGVSRVAFGGRPFPTQSDITPDGKRWLAIIPQETKPTLRVVTDWRALVSRRTQ